MGLSKCCRARWIAVVSSSLPRGGLPGKGKRGAEVSKASLRPFAFLGATQFEFCMHYMRGPTYASMTVVERRASMGELLPMAGQQAHHGQPSLRPNSLLQACNTPRRISGSVKAHHPRSADQSAISKPTVTLTRNVSSPVAAMSLRRWLLALTPPSAPMLPVPASDRAEQIQRLP
jgi:hypothetical protein